MARQIITFEGATPQLGERVFVAQSAEIIGRVTIGDDASIWPKVVIRGDVNEITIGARTNLQDGVIVHVANEKVDGHGYATIIESDVTVGHGALLHGCYIGEGALIGMRATLMDGSRVEKNGILGAGALLGPNKVVGEGEVWVGAPARRVRTLSMEEREELYQSAAQYVILKDRYRAEKAL